MIRRVCDLSLMLRRSNHCDSWSVGEWYGGETKNERKMAIVIEKGDLWETKIPVE